MKNFFLSYKNPISVILAVIIVGGIFLYGQVQVSLFPEITFPKLKVIADNGEQPVDKMMVTVTRPLEDAIKQVPDLKLLRSTTSRGTCEISAFLNWGADINAVSYTHLRAHETPEHLVCRLLLEKTKNHC